MNKWSLGHITLWTGFPHPKFGVQRPCESGDITFYLSRDNNIEESRDFVGGVLSFCINTLLSLGSKGLTELEIMTFVLLVPIPTPRFQC